MQMISNTFRGPNPVQQAQWCADMSSVAADTHQRAGSGRARLARLGLVIGPLVMIGSLAAGLGLSQHQSRTGVQDRFATRGATTADFIASYVGDLMDREHAAAEGSLTGRRVQRAFEDEVAAFGFQAAVLLDQTGRAIAVSPEAPTVVGQQLSVRYPHLAAAVAGHRAVSSVVASAAQGLPVVAFAVPFETPQGLRVFSGAYRISQTPLSTFLTVALTSPDARVYVTDGGGDVVASNRSLGSNVVAFADRDPALARGVLRRQQGTVNEAGTPYYFSRHRVPGTSWSLVTATPTSYLFASVSGTGRWVPWIILAGFALIAGIAAWLTGRLLNSRERLSDANARLERLARTDSLTGLFNRRYVTEQLTRLCTSARRHHVPVAVLMIDIDHFKRLNDTFGHAAGDDAIRHVADRLAASLRTEDIAGRWGGEEFVIVLPHTAHDEAVAVAERLRAEVAGSPLPIGAGDDVVSLSVSIGVAERPGDVPEALVHRADLALYAAKRAGRNRVVSASAVSR